MRQPDAPERSGGGSSGHVGVYVVDKPEGKSSMQVVSVVRRRAGGARTGHAGTLDPLATGVLVLALGRATKSLDRLMRTDKVYQTTIDLSAFTTTDDREGERTEVDVVDPPSVAAVEAVLDRFVGEIEQRPPAFSAVKIKGRRAYELARRGESVAPEARRVEIHSIELLDYVWPEMTIEVETAKGVYIRSLARDIGAALGTGGHCQTVRRTAVGPFTSEMAVPLDEVPDPLAPEMLLSLDRAMQLVESMNREDADP